MVLIVAKCIVNTVVNYDITLNYFVLIVAKCIVNGKHLRVNYSENWY